MEEIKVAVHLLWGLVVVSISGFTAAFGLIGYLTHRIWKLQRQVDEQRDQLGKFRTIADNCPVTGVTCPLRALFYGGKA